MTLLINKNEIKRYINIMNIDISLVDQLINIDPEIADKKLQLIVHYLEKILENIDTQIDLKSKEELNTAIRNLDNIIISAKKIKNDKLSRNIIDLAKALKITVINIDDLLKVS